MKKIGILAPIGMRIPPKRRGAAELIVYYLTQCLVKKGYKVLIFAPRTTKTEAELVPVSEKPVSEYKIPDYSEISRKLRIEVSILSNIFLEVVKRKREIGVIFNHTISGDFFAPLEKFIKIPVFHILHLPLYKETAKVYKEWNSKLIAISKTQKKPYPDLNYKSVIYNGINLKQFKFSNKSRNYFLFVGKLIPSKGADIAIKLIRKLKKKLILAGGIGNNLYFKTKIKPYLSKDIVYQGELSFSKLVQLYKKAKALLFPVKWEEPFGIVMIEALACGTPVIAFKRGAAPEIVKNNETGYIVENLKQMEQAIKNIDKISRPMCRKRVEENFTIEKMVEKYENVYYKLIK